MEVSGRIDKTANNLSTDADEVMCVACHHGGITSVAAGYCDTCQEYLCKACVFHHSNARITRNHILLDKSRMPNHPADQHRTSCTDVCQQHMDRFLEFFCKTHDKLGCYVCVSLQHQHCELKYIPEIAKSFQGDYEYICFEKSVRELNANVEGFLNDTASDLDTLKLMYDTALDKVKQFRAEISEHFDKKEKEIKHTLKEMKEYQEKLKEDSQTEGRTIQRKAREVRTTLMAEQDNPEKLFMFTKRSQALSEHLEKDLEALKLRRTQPGLFFSPCSDVMAMISQEWPLGDVSPYEEFKGSPTLDHLFDSTKKTEHLSMMPNGKICIRSPTDCALPRITGLAEASDNVILLADNVNKSVKFLDIRKKKLFARLELPSGPWDVAILPNNKAAVTIPNDRKIHIFLTNTTSRQAEDQSITFQVSGMCYGIAYRETEGTLIVSFRSPGKIQLLDLEGNVLKRISPEIDGQEILSIPHYVSVVTTADGTEEIYVSDFDHNSITKLSVDGKIISQVSDKEMNGPEGFVFTEDSRLVVCSYLGGNVHVLKEMGDQGLKSIVQWNCIEYPQCILMSKNRDCVFISTNNEDNFLYLYNMI